MTRGDAGRDIAAQAVSGDHDPVRIDAPCAREFLLLQS
jgi:hypothetical protein